LQSRSCICTKSRVADPTWGYRHGRYTTVDGLQRQRRQCPLCGRTWLEEEPLPLGRPPGPNDGYQVFWDSLLHNFTHLGITRAIGAAADAAGVKQPTASRWIHSPHPECIRPVPPALVVRCRLLEAALDAWRARWPMPQPARHHRSTSLCSGWEFTQSYVDILAHSPGGPLWQLIERACVVGAVVTGKPYPNWAKHLVPDFTDTWSGELQGGPLDRGPVAGRPRPDYSLRVWLGLEARRYGRPSGETWKTWTATAFVSTRNRVVGFATMALLPGENTPPSADGLYGGVSWSPIQLRPNAGVRRSDHIVMPAMWPPRKFRRHRRPASPLVIELRNWDDLDRDRGGADAFTRVFPET